MICAHHADSEAGDSMRGEGGGGVTLAILGMQKRRYDSLTELKIAAAREGGRGSWGKARQKPARIHGNMIFFVPAWTAGSSLRSRGRGLATKGRGDMREQGLC